MLIGSVCTTYTLLVISGYNIQGQTKTLLKINNTPGIHLKNPINLSFSKHNKNRKIKSTKIVNFQPSLFVLNAFTSQFVSYTPIADTT